MKYSECDARQKKAFRNILYAAYDYIGGLENTMSDRPEESDEYKAAAAILADHDKLVETIYEEAISAIYEEGACYTGEGAKKYLKDIRFCGKEWLMERCNARVKKLGY